MFSLASTAEAQKVAPLHFYELGVEVNGSRLSLLISDALTGESLWGGIVAETGGNPDVQFDTNGQGGPGIIVLPPGLLLLSFQPLSCAGISGCVPLGAPINYAWAGNSNPLTVGSFYRPAAGNGSIDTDFYLSNGSLGVHTNDSGISGNVDTYLGQTGWTLPYDRVTLCAQTACSNPGPESQFFSAGVQTQAPLPGFDGQRLVPTFAFKGSVAPLASWGAQNWDVPGLTLQFASSATLTAAGSLSTTGTTFTASSATQGWGGIRFNAGSAGTITGGEITAVRTYGGAAVSITNASPTLRGVEIRNSACCGTDGIYVTGSSSNPTIQEAVIRNMSGAGVTLDSYARARLVRNRIQNNGEDGVAAGFGVSMFLSPDAPNNDRIGNDVLTNAGNGIYAGPQADLTYGWYYYGGAGYAHTDGYNNVTNNQAAGNLVTGGGAIHGGNTDAQRRNGFYENTGNEVEASGSGSRAYVSCDYWGPGVTPPFQTAATGGGTVTLFSYLTQDPRSNPSEPCQPLSMGGEAEKQTATAARGAGTGLAADLEAAASLAMNRPAEALTMLRRVVAQGDDALASAALAEVARVASGPQALAAARVFLAEQAAGLPGRRRAAALRGLVGVRHSTGDAAGALAASQVLAAAGDAGDAAFGNLSAVYLLSEAGRGDEARAALASVERLMPGSRDAALARRHLGLAPAAGRGVGEGLAAAKTDAGAAALATDLLATRPNPTGGVATVPFRTAQAGHVRLAVYDVLGRAVTVLADAAFEAGEHAATLDASRLAPGVYVVRLSVEGTDGGTAQRTSRMTVAR